MKAAKKTIIETPRLKFRELVPADLDNIMLMFCDENTMQYWPRVQTREEGAEWIASQRDEYAKNGCSYWAVEMREGGEFIGQAGLTKHEVNGDAEISFGYMFLPSHSTSGYAVEVARGCLTYGFEKFQVSHIICLIRPENAPLIRIAERLGMTLGKTAMYRESLHNIWALEVVDKRTPQSRSAKPAAPVSFTN